MDIHLARARKLLAEAGYADGFGLVVNSSNDRYPNDSQVNQAVAQMWSRLGLKPTVNAMPKAMYSASPTGIQRAAKRELPTPANRCRSCSICWALQCREGDRRGNNGRYSSPHLDAILDRAAMTLDDGKRAALLAEAYEFAIGEEAAVIPMLFPITTWAMRKGVVYGGFPQEATVASLVHVVK